MRITAEALTIRFSRLVQALSGLHDDTCRPIAAEMPKVDKSTSRPKPDSGRPKALKREPVTLRSAISRFGEEAKKKLGNPSAKGQPEDQLRAPFERLLSDLASLRVPGADVTAIGETSLADAKTRPDYAVTVENVLVGFIELKAPGKGADPRKFKDPHDKAQWLRLQSLPNLIYTDGNSFSLWHSGELVGSTVDLDGDIESAGASLTAPESLLGLIETFLRWSPVAPRNVQQLADVSARLCRLLRDEVVEQLANKQSTLTALAADWRRMLFPDATDLQFADGYAQTVTFGMLMARARNIALAQDLDRAAQQLGPTVIGTALRVLTFGARDSLPVSIGTLMRVLDAVEWTKISNGKAEAWLYFYEDFLAVYDKELKKQTGSYYTSSEVVDEMVRLVDDVLQSRFSLAHGLASQEVTLVDPAVGTGTFLLGVLRKIASTVDGSMGPGAVASAIDAAIGRLLAFEIQLGPFAVAQLRLLAELTDLIGEPPSTQPRMFVTDTLASPYVEEEWLPQMYGPIAESRRQANKIKKEERIMVVLGNPPYKEKAKGRGGWIENDDSGKKAPLDAWLPPTDWGVGTHARHLRNLYIYFWRWATWKVFDQDANANHGIVCFISVAGFLNGPGFQRMRDYLRRTTDEIWVIDCSPEGHQPEVPTRMFEGVQQPICIVLASRSPNTDRSVPATVLYRALPLGPRTQKVEALRDVAIDGPGWSKCPTGWRDGFLPASEGAWESYPSLRDFFVYDGTGVMSGRTWITAPDSDSLRKRWQALVDAPAAKKEALFHPHLRNGKPGDKHVNKVVKTALVKGGKREISVAKDTGPCIAPIRYAFRSFDRQWIIPDNRVINQANPELWASHSSSQVYITAPFDRTPTAGPALTVTAHVPDVHHYHGRGGRVFPLWMNGSATTANIRPGILTALSSQYKRPVSAEDVLAYAVAVVSHSGFTSRFERDLAKPGIRVPLTADAGLFFEAVSVGCTAVWLQTYGERYVEPSAGRRARLPKLPADRQPKVPKGGNIGADPDDMPDDIRHDQATNRLYVGRGYIDGVTSAMWQYEVSGMPVIRQWFSYRARDRSRPIMGDRRPPSPLGDIQPDHWLAEYTEELINLLNVVGCLVDLEPVQKDLLDRICVGATLGVSDLGAESVALPKGFPSKPTELTGKERDGAQVNFGFDSHSTKKNSK